MTTGFDWDDANRTHIARHGVSVSEAEEACQASCSISIRTVNGQIRYEDVGATMTGRILKLVTTDRRGLVRIVTAYDATLGTKKHSLKIMDETL